MQAWPRWAREITKRDLAACLLGAARERDVRIGVSEALHVTKMKVLSTNGRFRSAADLCLARRHFELLFALKGRHGRC